MLNVQVNRFRWMVLVIVLCVLIITVLVNNVLQNSLSVRLGQDDNTTYAELGCWYFDGRKCFHLCWGRFNRSNVRSIYQNCTYIDIKIFQGRTGNQMFMVAALIGTAYKLDMIPLISTSTLLTKFFDLPNVSGGSVVNSSVFSLTSCCVYNRTIERLDSSKNWSLSGYYQSWKYFDFVNNYSVLSRVFSFKPNCRRYAFGYFSKTISTNVTICIHVRRGDMLRADHQRAGFGVVQHKHLSTIIQMYKEMYNDTSVIVMSDDIKWCRKTLNGQGIRFSEFNDACIELALMTMCNHVVVTSGSFGWWGAWLSGGEVYYYDGYPTKQSRLDNEMNRSDYYPSSWRNFS